MAASWLKVFMDAAEKAYNSGQFPLMSMAARTQNNRIRFIPLAQYNEGDDEVLEYAIQRRVRAKERAMVNDKTKGAGTDFINTLDRAQTLQWETVTTKRSTQMEFLVRTKWGEETNALADSSPYYGQIADQATNLLISKEERATQAILSNTTINAAALTMAVTSGTISNVFNNSKFAKFFIQEANRIKQKVDKFKYNCDAVVIYNVELGQAFSDLQGQVYSLGPNTFGKNYQEGFRYSGIDFIPSTIFKSIKLGVNANENKNKILLALVMDTSAYADSGLTQGYKNVSVPGIRSSVAGHIYDDLSAIVDDKRITPIYAAIEDVKTWGLIPANFTVQPKVND